METKVGPHLLEMFVADSEPLFVSFRLTADPQILISRSLISSFVTLDPEARYCHIKQSSSDCGEAATFWAVSVCFWGLFDVWFGSQVFMLKPQRSQCRRAHASQNKGVITLQPASCRGSPGAPWPTADSHLPGFQCSTLCRNNLNCELMLYLHRIYLKTSTSHLIWEGRFVSSTGKVLMCCFGVYKT